MRLSDPLLIIDEVVKRQERNEEAGNPKFQISTSPQIPYTINKMATHQHRLITLKPLNATEMMRQIHVHTWP